MVLLFITLLCQLRNLVSCNVTEPVRENIIKDLRLTLKHLLPSSDRFLYHSVKKAYPSWIDLRTHESTWNILLWLKKPFSNNFWQASRYLWDSSTLAASTGTGSWLQYLKSSDKTSSCYINIIYIICTHNISKKITTCIIFAGSTFSFVQLSRRTYVSRSFGTILACPISRLWHSLAYISIIAFQPNMSPSLECLKLLVPPVCEEKRAFIIFFIYANTPKWIMNSFYYMYLVAWTYQPVDQIRGIKWINKKRFHFKRITLSRLYTIGSASVTVSCFSSS